MLEGMSKVGEGREGEGDPKEGRREGEGEGQGQRLRQEPGLGLQQGWILWWEGWERTERTP